MPTTNVSLHTLPIYRRKYSAVEFKKDGISACSLTQGCSYVDDHIETKVKEYLLEHSKSAIKGVREIIDRRSLMGNSWYQLVFGTPGSDKDTRAGRTASNNTFYIIMASNIFCQLEGNVDGQPLYAALQQPLLITKPGKSGVTKVQVGDVLSDGGSNLKALLSMHEEVRKYIGGAQQFIDKNAPAALEQYVRKMAECDNVIAKSVVNFPIAVLAQLAHTVESMLRTLVSNAEGVLATTVKQSDRTKLPEFLTSKQSSVIADLCTSLTYDEMVSKQKKTLDIKASDLFKFNTVAGTIDFADNMLTQFVERDCELTFELIAQMSAWEVRFKKRIGQLPAAIVRKLALAALTGKPVDSDLRTLSSVYLPSVKDAVRYTSTADIPELTASVMADDEYLKEVTPVVLEVINAFYQPCTFETDMTGFSFTRAMVNGRDLIMRVTREKKKTVALHYVSADIEKSFGKNRNYYNFRMVEAAPEVVQQRNTFCEQTTFIGLAKSGKAGATEQTCALAFDTTDVLSLIAHLGYYVQDDVDLVNHTVISTVRQGLLTILPPSEGPDVVSFGSSGRRDITSYKFEVRKPNEESILDAMMSFPSEQVLDVDQDRLKALYTNRLKSLLSDPFDDTGILYCKEIGYTVRDALALFIANASSESVDIGAARRTIYLPNKFKDSDFARALPEFVSIPRSMTYEFVVPMDLFSDVVRRSLHSLGVYKGVTTARGTSLTILSKEILTSPEQKNISGTTLGKIKSKLNDLTFANGVKYTNNALVHVVLAPQECFSFTSQPIRDRKNKELLIRLDYSDMALNSLVKHNACVLGQSGPLDYGEAFKRTIAVNPEIPRINNAFEYAKNIVYSFIFNGNDYFEDLWVKDLCDTDIVVNELKVLADYVENYYSDELPLAAIHLQTSSTTGDLVKAIRDFVKEPELEGAKRIAQILSPVGLVSLSALALISPMPVDKFSNGTMNMLLNEKITYLKKPELGAKLQGYVFGTVFTDQDAKIIYAKMIEERFNSATLSMIAQKDSQSDDGNNKSPASSDSDDKSDNS